MDLDTIRQFRDRWQAIDEVEATERRTASLAERWKQLNQLLGMALALGLDLTRRDDEYEVRQRWLKLKDAV